MKKQGVGKVSSFLDCGESDMLFSGESILPDFPRFGFDPSG
jgi:hypothetical protein